LGEVGSVDEFINCVTISKFFSGRSYGHLHMERGIMHSDFWREGEG